MYTGVLYKNWIRDLFISICYPIGPPSKIHEENQATIKRLMLDRITLQARPIDVLITTIHELHPRFFLTMVDTRLNMQISDLNSKPHGIKSI